MKSFNQFLTICEAIYDRDKKSDVDLEVGKIGKERKKTTPERQKLQRTGDRLLKDIQKKKEKPASSYDPKLGK